MKVERVTSWRNVADAARTTVGKPPGKGEPSSSWKRAILKAEHSPIRQFIYRWKWTGIPSWVSVHFVRHKIGIEHFVKTQRTDRTESETPRGQLTQDSPVDHECIANAQAIINISRKRLCRLASKETRQTWQILIDEMAKVDPELASVCVPECVYRGHCPEMKSCGHSKTDKFQNKLLWYQR